MGVKDRRRKTKNIREQDLMQGKGIWGENEER